MLKLIHFTLFHSLYLVIPSSFASVIFHHSLFYHFIFCLHFSLFFICFLVSDFLDFFFFFTFFSFSLSLYIRYCFGSYALLHYLSCVSIYFLFLSLFARPFISFFIAFFPFHSIYFHFPLHLLGFYLSFLLPSFSSSSFPRSPLSTLHLPIL